MGGSILVYDEQFTNLIFWKSFKKYLLFAYTESTLNGEISPKSTYISFNNNSNKKNILDSFYLHYIGWIKLKNHLTLLSLQ
jgi:hypothetical protein